VADAEPAGEGGELVAREDLLHQAAPLVELQPLAVADDDAGSLLSPVLLRKEAVVDDIGRPVDIKYGHQAAGFAGRGEGVHSQILATHMPCSALVFVRRFRRSRCGPAVP